MFLLKLTYRYHNAFHASDVCQACSILFQECQPDQFPDIEILAFFMAAIAHDAAHPGRTNAFLMSTKNPIAMLYNGVSVR